jgi:hypothetical protein
MEITSLFADWPLRLEIVTLLVVGIRGVVAVERSSWGVVKVEDACALQEKDGMLFGSFGWIFLVF